MVIVCSRCRCEMTVAPPAAGREIRCPRCSAILDGGGSGAALGGDTQATADTGAPHESRTDYSFLTPPKRPGDLGCLGPYRILSVLGRGGMGVLFGAEDPALGRKVALKVMLPELAANATARRRFLREARAAAAVEHDHIVPIYQVAEAGGVPFIAMPLLKGESLEARLRREGLLPPEEVLRIGREIAEGLAAAHAAGLVHRDVKPDNVWLEAHPPGPPRVRLLDFGLARPVEESAGVTRDGAVLGTPAYMAPEQAEGRDVDARADLFSLGCVLYHMAAGRRPFAGKTILATLHAVLSDQPPAPHEVNATVAPPLEDLILRLLDKDPARRPQSASDVAAALDRLIAARPDGPSPVEVRVRGSTRAAPSNRRLPLFAVGVLLAAVGVGLLGGWLVWQRRGASAPVAGEGSPILPVSATANPPGVRWAVSSFQLYYGKDPVLHEQLLARVRKGQIVVIDPRGLAKPVLDGLLRRAEEVGAKVLAYLSIGELDGREEDVFRRFLASRPAEVGSTSGPDLKSIVLRRNDKFKSFHVDVLAEAWRTYVLAEVDRLYAAGLHGVLLDTVDTVDLYITNKEWFVSRRCRSVQAMLSLIRAIKARDRDKFVLQNRGLNLIGATVFVGDERGEEMPGLDFVAGHAANPDALLWENAFASQDAWSSAKEKQLREINESGKATVLALGYEAILKRRDNFVRRCKETGFVPAWATSSEKLHLELTSDPAAP